MQYKYRHCGNACKNSKRQSGGKRYLQTEGKLGSFSSDCEYLLSIGGVVVFYISIVLLMGWNGQIPAGVRPQQNYKLFRRWQSLEGTVNVRIPKAAWCAQNKHPWYSQRRTAKDEQPCIVNDEIFLCGRIWKDNMARLPPPQAIYSFWKKLFNCFGVCHGQHLHSCSHYTKEKILCPGDS